MTLDLTELKKDCLVFDIECSSPYDIKDFDNYVRAAKAKFIGFYSYKSEQYYFLPVSGNEDLIKKFIAEHRVIIGFNSVEFDAAILKNDYNMLWPEKGYKIELDLQRILCQVRGYLMGFKFKSNSLREVAKKMKLETAKGEIDYHIFEKDTWTPDELTLIKEYLKADVMATKEMFDKLWDFWTPFQEFLSEKNMRNMSFMACSEGSLAYKVYCHVVGCEEKYAEKGEETEGGGRVLEPRVTEAWNVWYCDGVSLYPHIYGQLNLFAEVPAGTPGAWHGNEVFKVNGYYSLEYHIFSEFLMKIIKERVRLKKEDPKNPRVYMLKIIANSVYGANRSEVFENLFTENSGEDCCSVGRQINEIMEKKADEMGYDTLSGDTDSVFLKYRNGERTYEEVTADLQKIEEYIKKYVPFPVETFKIAIEAKLDYIMYVREEGEKALKKNYCYIKSKKDGTKEVVVMGLPIKKENATSLGPLIFEKHIEPRMKIELKGKFEKSWLIDLVKMELSKDIFLMAQEYKCANLSSYTGAGLSSLPAQICREYLNGRYGKVKLLKNKKCGKVGGKFKYCTIEEAIENKITIDDLDFTKVFNELQPFCNESLDGATLKKPVSGFFKTTSTPAGVQSPVMINHPILTPKRGFFS